jgi:prepilin-type N-terminal cleavage/methylation domain-containing protein
MLTQTKKADGGKAVRGFTIIEVMIVLAIAGLILLIVFLAVPALQRSARNTQRKNDAAAISAAIASFISNNGGTVPTSLGKDADTTTLDLCSAGGNATGGVAICTANSNLETAKMGYYTPGNVSMANGGAGNVTPAVTSSTVVIETGEGCDATNTKGGAASPRTAAVFYATETSAASNTQCVEQ